jgi:hypothetical protein
MSGIEFHVCPDSGPLMISRIASEKPWAIEIRANQFFHLKLLKIRKSIYCLLWILFHKKHYFCGIESFFGRALAFP